MRIQILYAYATPPTPQIKARGSKPHRSAPEVIIRWPWAATDTFTPGETTTMASSATTPATIMRIQILYAYATPPTPTTQAKDSKPHRSAPEAIIRWPWAATDTPTPGETTSMANSATTPATMMRIQLLYAYATPPTPQIRAKDSKPHRSAPEKNIRWQSTRMGMLKHGETTIMASSVTTPLAARVFRCRWRSTCSR